MEIFVLVSNYEYESAECVIGVYSSLEKAQEAKSQVDFKYCDYVDIYKGALDSDVTEKVS